jgi:hypothetical protein
VATRSPAVAAEAAHEFTTWPGVLPPSAVRAFSVTGSAALHALINRLYRLALSLPPEPLLDFEEKIAGLPRETEAQRLVVQRIGQDVFRKSLIDYSCSFARGRSAIPSAYSPKCMGHNNS